MKKIIKNISLFSNAGIGEYGTNNISIQFNNIEYNVKTVISNELLKERAKIYKNNYPLSNMICGSITDYNIFSKIISSFKKELPTIGTFSPPCQGSSGLNAFKGKSNDFRNQLVKSIFQLFENVNNNNSLQFGYIENVVSYYKEEIPCLISNLNDFSSIENNNLNLYNDFVVNDKEEILNYKYFILVDDIKEVLSNIKNQNIISSYDYFTLKKGNGLNKKYCIGFNEIYNQNQLINILNEIEEDNNSIYIISPDTIENYIQLSLNKYGYNGILKNIRGEEFGAAQIRQRGFFVFFKANLDFKFPTFLYNNSKHDNYSGKTVLDAFKVNNLIEIIKNEEEFEKIKKLPNNKKYSLLFSKPFKKHNGKIYIDTSIDSSKAQEELSAWIDSNYEESLIPNLHFREKLKERFHIWVSNTKEGTSAYKNTQRIHRPYKLIKVFKNNKDIYTHKNEMNFVIKEDSIDFFEKNNIIDYALYVTKEMKEIEGNKEWGNGRRNWMLRDIKIRKELESTLIEKAINILKSTPEKEYMLIFFPIKGFEAATYKRISLLKPSNALTTKMGYGNSNTVHPIFDRVMTPAEVMSLFGLGYIINENLDYVKSNNYIPPHGIDKIKTFANLLYEINGEAIISSVAENLLKDLLIQYLNHKI
jgi:site-specific DNA-cytosine methylase